MQTLNLLQSSPEWHEFRAKHFGASEAAAMLGISKNLSRNDLLLYKKTGKSKEYSDWVQKNILDYGHEVEALAREVLESELGEDLYPVTCSNDWMLSASCDGLTLDGKIAFEHKQNNAELFDFIVQNGNLPDTHMPQCQQILLVTGAQKVIFVCSDGTASNRVTIEILPDQSWFDRIEKGWEQFAKDLQNFEPRELAEKPEPAAIMQLPALSIQIKGEVTVSNLPQFKAAAETFIAKINTDLQTDEDFVNAEATVKFCDETEKKLESAKAAAIVQTASIDELMRTINFIKESIRTKRLTLEKLVKTQKETIKNKIVEDGFFLCEKHADSIHDEFKQIHFLQICTNNILSKKNLESACKNKRTLASLHNAVDTEVAAIKIELDDIARVIRKNITHLPEDLSLFRDLQSIITKPEDDFKLLVESRLAEQKRKQEEEKQRAEAAIKAAEDRAKKQAEEAAQRAISEAKAAADKAQAEKLAAEDKAKADILAAEERGRVQAAAAAERERVAKVNTDKLAEQSVTQTNHPEPSEPSSNVKAIGITSTPEQRARLLEVSESLIAAGVDAKSARNIVALIFAGQIKHVSINFQS